MSGNGVNWEVVDAPMGVLYEGPQWIADAGAFQWVDIVGATVHRWDPDAGAPAETRKLDLEFVTMALPLDGDRSLVTSRSTLLEYSWTNDRLTPLGEWNFDPDVRFNDGAIAPGGAAYLGTMSMQRRLGGAALWRWDQSSGDLHAVATGIGISNGLAWVTATEGFYVDSLVPQLDRIRVADDRVQRTPWVSFDRPGEEPDGLTVDVDGTVLVAIWGGSRIERLSESAGRKQPLAVPCLLPTSVTVGGIDSELLLVTTAGDDETAADARVLLARDGQWRSSK